MSTQGYVKLHRQITENPIWAEKPFSFGQAWIDLLLMANYKDKKSYKDGNVILYKRGTVTTSLYILSDKWGWDRKKVRKFLKVLELDEMVTINSSTRGTIITIVNYDIYQDSGTTDGTTVSPTPSPTVSPTPSPILKKEKNEKKEKNYKGFTPPTLEEVKEYIRERRSPVDAETFFEYFSKGNWIDSKGNKVRNWKQKLITWEKYQTPEKNQKQKLQNDFIEGNLADDLDEIERLSAERMMRA